MKTIKLLLFGIVILTAFLMVFPVGPSGLYYDDAGCLHAGKFFLSHPGSILSFKTPEVLKDVSQFERIPWIYYRPIERIIWTVCFIIFGPNTIMIGFLQKILFLLSIFVIYKLGRLLSDWVCGLIAVIIFISILLPYGLLVYHTWLATQFGLLFLLCGIYFTFKGFLSGRMPFVYSGILLVFLSWLTRESYIYISLAVILMYVCDYLFNQQRTESKNKKLKFICIVLFLGIILYGFILVTTLISGFVGLGFHKLSVKNFIPNIFFYSGEIFSNINSIFIIICLGLFFVFKDRLQFIGLVWALAGLVPLLFSQNISKAYLFNFFVGFSLFCGSGVSLLFKEFFGQKKLLEQHLRKFLVGYDNKSMRLSMLLIVILVFLFAGSGIKNLKELRKTVIYSRSKFFLRQERFMYFKNLQKGQSVFVPNLKAKEFYSALADVIDRQDIKIKLITSWDDLKGIILGENLLKNASFEDGFSQWEYKGKIPGLVKVIENYGFEGKRSLLVNALVLQGHDYDLIDCGQLFSVTPGETYIFGGIVKLSNFKEGARFEISAPAGAQEGSWQTDIKSGTNNWQVLFNSFTPVNKNQSKLFFYAIRSANLIRGKASIDGVFIYKVKENILAYD